MHRKLARCGRIGAVARNAGGVTSTLGWVRGVYEDPGTSAADNKIVQLTTLSDIQTVRRCIVTFQIFTFANAALADFTGRVINYGVSMDPSTITPQYMPYTDSNTIDPHNGLSPWLYWDSVTWDRWQVYPPATTSPTTTTQHANETHIDTTAQRKSYQTSTGLWFTAQSASQVAPGVDFYCSLSYSVLIETKS